ncbi:MAG: ankyrin repeat domain-containing protein, partial [Alphaproteobacteria bacterium]|nr:ankyrin repeat domain-containing protein [Alphaproteobacteria bacterium]
MIYADGMHGQFRLGYGAQSIHSAAAMAGDRTEIDDLVAGGANPDCRDAGGCTPLHYAAWNNPVGEVAAALFEAGADPEACDGHGRKPLDYAISAANDAFIEAALDAGADPAGGGEAVEDAHDQARYGCPAFRKIRAYRRLMRAGSRLRLLD